MPQVYAFPTGFTAIAVGKSVSTETYLYVVGITDTSGNPPWEIAVLRSTDEGETWSEMDSTNRIDYPETDDTLCVYFAVPRVYFGLNRISIVYSERRLVSNNYRNYYYLYVFNMCGYTSAPDVWQGGGWVWSGQFSFPTSDGPPDLQIYSMVMNNDNVIVIYSDSWITGNYVYDGGYYAKLINNSMTVYQLLHGEANLQYYGMRGCGPIDTSNGRYYINYVDSRIMYSDLTLSDEAWISLHFPEGQILTGEQLGYFACGYGEGAIDSGVFHFIIPYGYTGYASIETVNSNLQHDTITVELPGMTTPQTLGLFQGTSMLFADKSGDSSTLRLVWQRNGVWEAVIEDQGYDFSGDHYMPWRTLSLYLSDFSEHHFFIRGPDNARVLWDVKPTMYAVVPPAGMRLGTIDPNVSAISYTAQPAQDITLDGWRAQNGDITNIYEYIDEDAPADADFILNDVDAADENCIYRCKLASLSTPSSLSDWYLSTKVWRGEGSPIPTPSLKIRLVEGTTTIAEFTHTDLATGATRFDDQPTPTELGNVTDWTNLYLELEAYYT